MITVPVNGSGNTTFEVLVNDSDPDGDSISIDTFTQPQQGTITRVSGPNGPNTLFQYTAPNPPSITAELHEFTYTITDGSLMSFPVTVLLSVGAGPPINTPPTADAGNDQSFRTVPTQITLNGSSSFDTSPGSIVSYEWFRQSGTTPVNIASPNSAVTTVTGLSDGVYRFRLTVTDNEGAMGTDTVVIMVDEIRDPGGGSCPDPTDANDPDCPCGPGTPIPNCQ